MMVLSISFLYAKDSKLRTEWHDAKTKAKEQYKKLQDKATDEQKASLNLTESFDNLFTFGSNLGPSLDDLKKIQAKKLKDFDDDNDPDFVIPKKMTWKKLIKRKKKDDLFSGFRAFFSRKMATENINFYLALQKADLINKKDLDKLEDDDDYAKKLKTIKKIWKVYVKKKNVNIGSKQFDGWKKWKEQDYPNVIQLQSNTYKIGALLKDSTGEVRENINDIWIKFQSDMRDEIRGQEKAKKKAFRKAKSKVLYIINKYQEHINDVANDKEWDEKEIATKFWDTMDDKLEEIESNLSQQNYDTKKKFRLK